MRLHFQQKPWDLYVSLGYTAVMATILVASNTGNLAAMFLMLFVPGYVLVAALFPGSLRADKPEVDWIERIALSLGLSIAVVPLLGLLLNFTPWGIRFVPIVVTIASFTGGLGYVAYWRRMRLKPDQRLSLTLDFTSPDWKEYSVLDKGLAVVLSASIVIAGGTLAYLILTPRPGETFTAFYILGPGGNASNYPTDLNISQPGSVIVGIANHETTTVAYTVRVDLVGVRLLVNATSGLNQTVDVNRTTWTTFNATLSDGQTLTQSYLFRIDGVGLWRVQFLLFRGGDFASAYRELHLYVRVT